MITTAIDPAKDVDGLHPYNLGRLAVGLPTFVPSHPGENDAYASGDRLRGLLRKRGGGRSDAPISWGNRSLCLLLAKNATGPLCRRSKTRDLAGKVSAVRRDIIRAAAVGVPKLVKGD